MFPKKSINTFVKTLSGNNFIPSLYTPECDGDDQLMDIRK